MSKAVELAPFSFLEVREDQALLISANIFLKNVLTLKRWGV